MNENISVEDVQSFDVEAYLEEQRLSAEGQIDHEKTHGPVSAVAEKYDSETLNYLLNNITDSFHTYITSSISKAHLSDDGKERLRLLASEFTDKEIVVSLIKDYDDVKAQLNNFREVAKYSKMGLRRIDACTQFYTILSAIETHYKLKLTRAWKGFERVEQQTQRIKSETSSSYADNTQREEATGLRKIAMNLKAGR